jgi:pyruvate,water dikinase
MRQIFREVGNRLAERGCIERADDFAYLVPDQMQEAIANGGSYVDQVVGDKAEMAKWASVTPPQFIGTDHGEPPDSAMGRAMARFWGTPPRATTDATEVIGLPVSTGIARGTARLIMSLREADRLQRGDILVAPTTAPPWTPLFGIAAGVVTDTGGALSHCGIVSREYGIPCVGGTGNGTTAIKDGQLIEVDGSAGIVKIITDG